MNRFKIIPVFLFLLIYSISYAQTDEIKIFETHSGEVCGYKAYIDGIWMNEGKIKADISYFPDERGKPITGGYKKGDKITFPEGCEYYIFLINKTGIDNPGFVILSKTEPLIPAFQLFDDYLIFYTGRSYAVDTLNWLIDYLDSFGVIKPFVITDYLGIKVDTFFLNIGNIFWNGECAYKIDTIHASEFNPNEMILRFKKQNELLYSNNDVIPGELYNRQYNYSSHPVGYIIRKMKIFTRMKPSEEEIKNTQEKIWLLKVYFYPRNISSLVIEIKKEGKRIQVEYDTLKYFEDEEEAFKYADENNFTILK